MRRQIAVPDTLRISMDAKATVNVLSVPARVAVRAEHPGPARPITTLQAAARCDAGRDFPTRPWDELFLYAVTSKVTSDCLVDCLVAWWTERVQLRFAHITTLVINLDNGPENHSWRTQFMQRLVNFVDQSPGFDGAAGLLSALP